MTPPGVKILGLVNPHFILQIFSFLCSRIKGFHLIFPLRVTRDQRIFRFWHCSVGSLTLRYDAHPGVFWEIFEHLTLRCDAHRGAWLPCSEKHTAELNSHAVRSTPRSLTLHVMHPAEFLKNLNISAKSKKNWKMFVRGPDGFESWKN